MIHHHGDISVTAVGALMASIAGALNLAIPMTAIDGMTRLLWTFPIAVVGGVGGAIGAALWKRAAEHFKRDVSPKEPKP